MLVIFYEIFHDPLFSHSGILFDYFCGEMKKRQDRARRAKLFDPRPLVGVTVPSSEKKNPITKAKRKSEAKVKVSKTMARNEQVRFDFFFFDFFNFLFSISLFFY